MKHYFKLLLSCIIVFIMILTLIVNKTCNQTTVWFGKLLLLALNRLNKASYKRYYDVLGNDFRCLNISESL